MISNEMLARVQDLWPSLQWSSIASMMLGRSGVFLVTITVNEADTTYAVWCILAEAPDTVHPAIDLLPRWTRFETLLDALEACRTALRMHRANVSTILGE